MIFPFITIFFSLSSYAQEASPILTLLNKEMAAITKLKEQKKVKAFQYHRLLELYAEKCKYIREEENKSFFEAMKKNEKLEKSHFYGKTKNLYAESLLLGKEIIKNFPHYDRLGQVYYTLALNSRDYSNDKLAEGFFIKSLEFLSSKHPLRLQVEASLGDYYYNEKTYDKAKKIYEVVLMKKDHEWWSKYAYNYAWCLLKLEHNQKALSMMLEAYNEGKKKTAINMQEEIIQNIGLFFYYAKELDRSLKFYSSESKDFATLAIKMGTLLMKKGNLKEAENYLSETESMVKTTSDQVLVKLALLELYREKIEITKHLQKLRELRLLKNDIVQLNRTEDFTYNLKLLIKELQNMLLRKPERHDIAHAIVEEYDALIEFDPKDKISYLFYSGESLYGAALYQESLNFYHSSIIGSSAAEIKWVNLSFESMLSVYKILGKASEKGDVLISICEKYLSIAPKDQHSSYSYKRLFLEYHKNLKIPEIEKLISQYHSNFPQEVEYQRDMQSKFITSLIETNNILKLREWVSKVDQGYLAFDQDYKTKIWNILGNILLNKSLSPKPSEENLALAQEIYAQEKFDSSIRIKASYNTAVAFLKLNQTENANTWLLKSMKLLPESELQKLFGDFMAFLSGYFMNEDSQSLYNLSSNLIEDYCSKDSQKMKDVYTYSSQALLMAGEIEHLSTLRKMAIGCQLSNSVLVSLDQQFLKVAFEKRDFKLFQAFNLFSPKDLEIQYLTYLEQWAQEGHLEVKKLWSDLSSNTNNIENDFFKSKLATTKVTPIQDKLRSIRNISFDSLVKNFDEAQFAQLIEKVISDIAVSKNDILEVAKLKNDKVTATLLSDLCQTYLDLSEKFLAFKPKIADDNYRWSIRVTMKQMKKTLMNEEKIMAKKLKEFPADLLHHSKNSKVSSISLIEIH
jgi:hypothetical protein